MKNLHITPSISMVRKYTYLQMHSANRTLWESDGLSGNSPHHPLVSEHFEPDFVPVSLESITLIW